MMAFFIGTKKTKLLTAFLLILSLIITYAAPISVYAEGDDATPTVTKYFRVNLFNYDKTEVNQADLDLPGATKSAILGFHGTNETGYGPHTTYHGSSSAPEVYTGIVENNLTSSGKIQFDQDIKSIDLFNTDSAYYDSYSNVAFPFTYDSDTGYYGYDSAAHSATFDQDHRRIDVGTNSNGGFWVFGKTPATGTQTGDYHFGMNMSVNFFIPANRTVDGTVGGDHLEFTFKGDDDVWVFIDGRLVLDLGGIHNAAEGKIDFTTGKVTSPKSTTTSGGIEDNSFIQGLAASESHNLKVFYLERGAGESNLKMNFNLAPLEQLSVEKKIERSYEKGGSLFGSDDSFKFVLETSDFDAVPVAYAARSYSSVEGLLPAANAKYDLYKDGIYVKSGTTTSNGEFFLKDGEKAVFTKLDSQQYFQVYEDDVNYDRYDEEKWELPDPNRQELSNNKGTVRGFLQGSALPGDYALKCVNRLKATDVRFNKRDGETEGPVDGAVFQLVPTSGTITGIATAVSTDGGIVTFRGVPIGMYQMKEISAPSGYQLDETEYTVEVGYPTQAQAAAVYSATLSDGDDVYKKYSHLSVLIMKNGSPIIGNAIMNEKKLIDLTITKKVQGSHAPEITSENPPVNVPAEETSGDVLRIIAPPTAVLYPFTIQFDKEYTIASPEAIVSKGAFDFEGEGSVYTFKLASGGSITLPVKGGVRYTVHEGDISGGAYRTYYSLKGDINYNDGDGISAISTTTSTISVLNQYPNDGLTVLKTVTGNKAVSGAAYSFKAKFWVPEAKEIMEGTVLEEAQQRAGEAETSLGAVQLTEEEATSLGALQTAVSDAGIKAKDLKDDMKLAEAEFNEAADNLEKATASESALQAEYDATSESAILAAIEALDLNGLKETKRNKKIAYDEANDNYEKAVLAEKTAKEDLDALINDNPNIKAYMDAQAAYEAAQAELDKLSDPAELQENILQKILHRIVGFFIDLIVGEDYGEGVDIACTGSAEDFQITSDGETSGCAFSLKDQETATFNFDEYFNNHSEVDRIYFEITETDSKGAKSVNIGTEGGDRMPMTPEVEGKMIKGYVGRATENPVIEYNNIFDDRLPRKSIVNHWTDKGVLLTSESSIQYTGDDYLFRAIDYSDYTFSTVSAIGIPNTPADNGTYNGKVPNEEGDIVITYIYTAKPVSDDPVNDRPNRRNRTTTVAEEPTPAAPVTPEAVEIPATSSVVDEAIPAAPLPKTGGVAPYLLYGLGLLLAGGGVALKRKDK